MKKQIFNKIGGSGKQNLYGVLFLLTIISVIVGTTITSEAVIAPASYVIYKDGTTYYAQNGQTGVNDYSGTDATTVIQSAINALTSGGMIFIKRGTYNLSDSIYIDKDGITLCGEGPTSVIRATTGFAPSRQVLNNCAGLIAIYDTRSDIVIRNLKLQLVTGMTYGGNKMGIHTGSPTGQLVQRVTIENVEIDGAGVGNAYGILFETGGRGTRISGCYVHDFSGSGSSGIVHHTHTNESYNIRITDNHVVNIWDDAIAAAGGLGALMHEVCISGNTISKNGGAGAAIKLDCGPDTGTGPYLSGVAVYGNVAETSSINADFAITLLSQSVTGMRDISVVGNTFRCTGSGTWTRGIFVAPAHRTVFANNVFQTVQTYGIETQPSTDIRFIGNNFKLTGVSSKAIQVNAAGTVLDTACRLDFLFNTFYGYNTAVSEGAGLATPITLNYIGNNFVEGTGGSTFQTGAGITRLFRHNIGFNPQGVAAITVGASPFTYTNNDGDPQAIYIYGGTVSNISKNGTTIFTSTQKTIWLEPGESVTVTYSGAPTMRKDRK